ncbi:MAG: YidC/Oxa1 family membrane protein insertase, partial [Chitinivibrionales bacterium]|nr:YidC/Oxa1 family membrane protein insertase [Chitinivibrionales bacterium]
GFSIPFYGNNFALLPVLMAVAMYFQNKMTIKDPNQKAMIYMMPVLMLVMFNNFPSGLSLYFVFSSVFQIVQQIIIERTKKSVVVTK